MSGNKAAAPMNFEAPKRSAGRSFEKGKAQKTHALEQAGGHNEKVDSSAKGKPSTNQPKEKYKPTAREQEAIDSFVAARKARKLSSRLTIKKSASDGFDVVVDHKDQFTGHILLMQALGTADLDFVGGLMRQVSNAAWKGHEPRQEDANFMLSVMCGIEPKDQVEAMLAAQMAAVHMATMTFARRLANVDTVPQQDSAERALNKLARTFTTQIEALKRYRSTGQQKVTVKACHCASRGAGHCRKHFPWHAFE
jgi:hypothetical protein